MLYSLYSGKNNSYLKVNLSDSWVVQKVTYNTHTVQRRGEAVIAHVCLYVHLVTSPHLPPLTSACANTVNWQPRQSSWARGGETAKARFPLVFPVSQSVYNSTTAGCHGAAVNELQMPDIGANQRVAVSHHGPQVPPSETLLRARSSCSSSRPPDLLLALHSPALYSSASL